MMIARHLPCKFLDDIDDRHLHRGLISLHFALFIVVQLFVEPRKRRILKDELSTLITDTSALDTSTLSAQIAEQLRPIAAHLAAIDAKSQQSKGSSPSTFLEDSHAQEDIAPVEVMREPESASMPYPKDRLFAKGVLVGAILGATSTFLFFLNGR